MYNLWNTPSLACIADYFCKVPISCVPPCRYDNISVNEVGLEEVRVDSEYTDDEMMGTTQIDDDLPFPQLYPIVFHYLTQKSIPRRWCLKLVANPYPFYCR